jgi:hypothetical protein
VRSKPFGRRSRTAETAPPPKQTTAARDYKSRHYLSKGTVRLIRWVTISSGIFGPLFLLRGNYYSDDLDPYNWALDIFPTWFYGAVWVVCFLLGCFILSELLDPHWRFPLLAMFAFNQFMFSVAIITRTWEGSPGAIVGSMQWLGYVYFSVATLLDTRTPEAQRLESRVAQQQHRNEEI